MENAKSFTLIELIVTMVIIGILLVPLGVMIGQFTQSIPYSRDLGASSELVKTEMAKINNLAYNDSTLAVGYDVVTSNYQGYPYDLRRTVSAGPIAGSKQVQVRVFSPGNTANPITNSLAYLASSVTFGADSSGGTPRAANQAASLVVSGGSISGKNLINVSLQNTSASPITITGIIITFSGAGGIRLNTITMNSIVRWSGSATSPSTITLTSSFTLAANTTYSNPTLLAFSKNLSAVSSLIFVMGDASQTSSYSW